MKRPNKEKEVEIGLLKNEKLLPSRKFLGSGTGPQKYAMKLLTGLEVGPPRFPLKPMPQELVDEMERDLRDLGVDFVYKNAKLLL